MFAGIKREKLEKIEVINLERRQYDSINLSPLKDCSKLKILNLGYNNLKKIDLRVLKNCTQLEEIIIMYNKLEEIELSHFPNLKVLNLIDNNLSSIDLKPLENCTELSFLNLGRNKLEEINLEPLHNCVSLDALFLLSNQIKTIDLSPLEKCDNLEILYLEDNLLEEIDLSVLECKTNFETLWLSKNRLISVDLSPFAKETSDEKTESDVKHKRLSILLNNNQLRTIDLSPLANHQRLSSLSLESNLLEKIDLTPLEKCRNLSILRIDRNKLTCIDLSSLENHTELKDLYLGYNPIQDLDLSVLTKCTKLNISHPNVKSLIWSNDEEPHFKHPLYNTFRRIKMKLEEEAFQAQERERIKQDEMKIHADANIDDLNEALAKYVKIPESSDEAHRYKSPNSYIVERYVDILYQKGNKESITPLEMIISNFMHDFTQEFTGVFYQDSPFGYSIREPNQNWINCFRKVLETLMTLNKERAIAKILDIYHEWMMLDSGEFNSEWEYSRYSLTSNVISIVNSFAVGITDRNFLDGVRKIVEESLNYILNPDNEDHSLEFRDIYVNLLQNNDFLRKKPNFLLIFLFQLLEKKEGPEFIDEIREKYKSHLKSD